MAQHWTPEQIDHEKQILTNQLMTKSGRFAIFVLRTYRYIAWECQNNHSNWCYADRISGRHLLAYVYNGPADHMGREVVEDAKDKLKKMGYIAYRKEDGRWKLYIKKEIDFCDIRQYVANTPEDPDFFDRSISICCKAGSRSTRIRKLAGNVTRAPTSTRTFSAASWKKSSEKNMRRSITPGSTCDCMKGSGSAASRNWTSIFPISIRRYRSDIPERWTGIITCAAVHTAVRIRASILPFIVRKS